MSDTGEHPTEKTIADEIILERSGSNLENAGDVHTEMLRGSAALEAAKRSDPPRPFGLMMIKLYLIVVVGFLCSSLNGFDGSLMGALLNLTQFRDTFGSGLVGKRASIISGMYTIGGVSALPIVGPCLDNFGRRFGMFIGCLVVVIGTIIGGTSNNLGQFLGSRFLLGWGYSIAASAAPAYVVEISHPAYRGVLTGLYNCQYYVGSITAAGVVRATVHYSGSSAWRVPIWCQLICSSIVCLFVWFLPESPRWLYSHGHQEKAWDVITKYHGEGCRENAFVKLQIREYEEDITMNGSDKRFWDYSELFKTHNSRWRVMCMLIPSCFGQWSGGGVNSYYIGGLLASAGVTNPTTVLNINLGSTLVSAAGAYTGASFVGKWRRRPMLIGVNLACSAIFIGITASTGIYASNGAATTATACIVFIFLFGFFYSMGWTPLQALYPVECLSYEIRAKGMALSSVAVNIASLVNQYGFGNAMAKIGWYTYIVLTLWNLVQAFVCWLVAVETNNRTLEELGYIFDAPNPQKESVKRRKVVVSNETKQILDVSADVV